jgi:hypothetical protein
MTLSVAFLISWVLVINPNASPNSAKPQRAIVDMGGGGGYPWEADGRFCERGHSKC